VQAEETFYTEHQHQVPEENKLSTTTSEPSAVNSEVSSENQIVPELGMPVGVALPVSAPPSYNMARQDQLTVIEPISRRTSYQHIVHTEDVIHVNGSTALTRLVTTLTEWLVILQGVAEDRECDRPNAKCRCCKAEKLQTQLQELGRKLTNAEQIYERVGMVGDDEIQDISDRVQKIAGMLRSEVSILIPTSVGAADPMVVEQARWIVNDIDNKNCASEAVEGVNSLVLKLLGVENCQTCRPTQYEESTTQHFSPGDCSQTTTDGGGGASHDVDMDIYNLVAGWCSGYAEPPTQEPKQDDPQIAHWKEVGRQMCENSRKRKQPLPVKIPSPIINRKTRKMEQQVVRSKTPDTIIPTNTVTPDEDPNILGLLEKRKKGVKKDGLYKFVLWREALRDEKAKASD